MESADTIPRAATAAGEKLIIRGHTYDKFYGTPLDLALRSQDISHLFLTGITTDVRELHAHRIRIAVSRHRHYRRLRLALARVARGLLQDLAAQIRAAEKHGGRVDEISV